MDRNVTDTTSQSFTGDLYNTENVTYNDNRNVARTDELNTGTDELNTENVELNTGNDRVSPEFPLSKRQAGRFLSVADMTVGRWIDSLESVGIAITDSKNKITRHGFTHLQAVKKASQDGMKPGDYIGSLIPLETVTVETVDSSFTDDVFPESTALAIVNEDLHRVSDITSRSLARVSRLKSEFSEFLAEMETDRQLQSEIKEMRQAKIHEQALSEFIEDERLKAKIKRQLLAQKLATELGQ